jgi:hypothetical protein
MIHRDQAGRPLTRQDHAVHRAVVSMSGNRSLLEAWSGLDFPLHVSRRHAGEGVIDHTEALREHDAIVDALLGRGPASPGCCRRSPHQPRRGQAGAAAPSRAGPAGRPRDRRHPERRDGRPPGPATAAALRRLERRSVSARSGPPSRRSASVTSTQIASVELVRRELPPQPDFRWRAGPAEQRTGPHRRGARDHDGGRSRRPGHHLPRRDRRGHRDPPAGAGAARAGPAGPRAPVAPGLGARPHRGAADLRPRAWPTSRCGTWPAR